MKTTLSGPKDIGPLVRATRKAQRMRQDDTAGAIGVSENFLAKIERGGETAQWSKLFQVLHGLGITVTLDIPDEAARFLRPETQSDK